MNDVLRWALTAALLGVPADVAMATDLQSPSAPCDSPRPEDCEGKAEQGSPSSEDADDDDEDDDDQFELIDDLLEESEESDDEDFDEDTFDQDS